MKKSKSNQVSQKRDFNILLSQRGEINMNTKTVKNKKAYNRKEKHKSASMGW